MQAVQGLESSTTGQAGQAGRGQAQTAGLDRERHQKQQQGDARQGQHAQRDGRDAPAGANSQGSQQQRGQHRQGQGRTLPLPPKLPQPGTQGPPAGLQVSTD